MLISFTSSLNQDVKKVIHMLSVLLKHRNTNNTGLKLSPLIHVTQQHDAKLDEMQRKITVLYIMMHVGK